jgi:uncharacterized delta-60 repeat protein
MDILETGPNIYDIIWNTTWGGSEIDEGRAIALDSEGYLYASGQTQSFGKGSSDIALVKFHEDGSKIWNITWGGSSVDLAYDIKIDSNNSIYIGGTSTGHNLALLKYDRNGTRIWNITWGGSGAEECMALTIGKSGSIYCAGFTESLGAGNRDFLLIKYFPNNTKAWNVTWGGINRDEAKDIAIDSEGFVYCAGFTESYSEGMSDFALVKFDPNGTLLWNKSWGGVGMDEIMGMERDSEDNIYFTGYSETMGENSADLVVMKYYPNGTLHNITWGMYDCTLGTDIELDSNGSLYCSGITYVEPFGDFQFVMVKFYSNFTRAWNITWGQLGIENDAGWDLEIGPKGLIYCAGYTASYGAEDLDFLVMKIEDLWTPEAPVLQQIMIEGENVIINWSDIRHARKYYIYKENSSITTINGLVPYAISTINSFVDSKNSLLDRHTYYYAIVAGNILGNSSGSNCLNFTRIDKITPDLQAITPNISTTGIITLNWEDDQYIAKYLIYRDTSNITSVSGLTPIANTTDGYYIDTLTSSGLYYYVIVAEYDGPIYGPPSNCVEVSVELPATSNDIAGFELYILVMTLFGIIIHKGIRKVKKK